MDPVQLLGKAPLLRLGWKRLAATNALAYYAVKLVAGAKKFYSTGLDLLC